MSRFLLLLIPVWLLSNCAVKPTPRVDRTPPPPQALDFASKRITALMVTKQEDIREWISQGFPKAKAPRDADGGTASPISADGYFLTAEHVIKKAPAATIHVLYGRGSAMKVSKARIVWRDAKHDLALIHAPIATPFYYRFTPPRVVLPEGTPVFHGGLTTGLTPVYGSLGSTIPEQGSFTSAHRFRIDIPLQPGDSGGPILDAKGNLVGVNSSVEFLIPLETPIFTESHGTRPNVERLLKAMVQDRKRSRP